MNKKAHFTEVTILELLVRFVIVLAVVVALAAGLRRLLDWLVGYGHRQLRDVAFWVVLPLFLAIFHYVFAIPFRKYLSTRRRISRGIKK